MGFQVPWRLFFLLSVLYLCFYFSYAWEHHHPKHHYKHGGAKSYGHHGKHFGKKHHSAFDKGHHGHHHGHYKKGHKDHGWKKWHFKKGYKHGYHAYGTQFGHGNKDYGHAAKKYGGHHKDFGKKHWGHKHGGHHGHHSGHHKKGHKHWWKHGEHKRSIPDSYYDIPAQSRSIQQVLVKLNRSLIEGRDPKPKMLFLKREYPEPYLDNEGRLLMKEISIYQVQLNDNIAADNSKAKKEEKADSHAKSGAVSSLDQSLAARGLLPKIRNYGLPSRGIPKIAPFLASEGTKDMMMSLPKSIQDDIKKNQPPPMSHNYKTAAQSEGEDAGGEDDFEAEEDGDDGSYVADEEESGDEYTGVEGDADAGNLEEK